MQDREILDDLTGHDFEELMVDVFRKLGYGDVRETRKTADEGKDILMEDDEGQVIVECKHTNKVSRPVVQKLHSAVSTTPEAERGMVVCTGRFTKPAKEYAEKVSSNGVEEIKLMNGDDLRRIGDDIGLDLYSGKIEIICNKSLPYPKKRQKVTSNIYSALDDVEAFERKYIDEINSELVFRPSVKVSYNIDSVFETSVGIVSTARDNGSIVVWSNEKEDYLLGDDKEDIVKSTRSREEIEESKVEEEFDYIEVNRFRTTETGYKEYAVEAIRGKYEHNTRYTGKNNVTYNKTCTPKKSDVQIRELEPLYIPEFNNDVEIKDYSYKYDVMQTTEESSVLQTELNECIHCSRDEGALTFCKGCGSINCKLHTKTERLEDQPVCTECAVTQKFFLKKKYFYNQENLNDFQRIYSDMPFYKKPLENKSLVYSTLLTIAVVLIFMAAMI